MIIDDWLLIIDCWLLITDYWLLIIDYWLLIADYWLLIADCWLLIADDWLFADLAPCCGNNGVEELVDADSICVYRVELRIVQITIIM